MAFPGNQYKLLALDLDGTLLNEKNRVSPRDAQAVRRAQERGVQIVLCTGRNVREVRAFSDQLLAPPDYREMSSMIRCGRTAAAGCRAAVFQRSEPDALRGNSRALRGI